MLKVGGIWCSPIEIESALIEPPEVLEAAVVGAPDESGLDQARGVRGAARRAPADRRARRASSWLHCKSRLAPYKYPRWIHFVPELPKTATGKIQRFRLRQLAEAPAAAAGSSR